MKIKSKLFLKIISSLIIISFLLWIVFLKISKPKPSQIFEAGPLGEEAYFELKKGTALEGANLVINVLLDTCAGTNCADLISADVQIKFDTDKLQPVDSQAQIPTPLFTNYAINNIDTAEGIVYVAAFTTTPGSPYNSSGKNDDNKIFAQIKFNVLDDSSDITLLIQSPGGTTDWTNAYMQNFSGDIINQSLAANNGNLTIPSLNPSEKPCKKEGESGIF